MLWLRRFSILLAFMLLISFGAWLLPRILDPTDKDPERRARDRRWVNSSPYFLDRQACRWLSLCGLHHLRSDPATRGDNDDEEPEWGDLKRRSLAWEPEEIPRHDHKRNINQRRRILRDVPDYVTKYAPLVHLYSGEEFWPSDIRQHVEHMTAYVADELINSTEKWTLHNLHELNRHSGKVTLRSDDDVESRPNWLHSHYNIPKPFPDDRDGDEDTKAPVGNPGGNPGGQPESREPSTWYDVDKKRPVHKISDPRNRKFQHHRRAESYGHKPDENGYSAAPAVLVVVDKGSGIVDAFWFFFYSYNLGQTVLGIRFGNHVGDWEHCMVRFEHGIPRGMFFSEHEGGQAYAFEAVEKRGERPVIYSAVGSHAMYALPGEHPYIIPFKLLKDVTDKGPLWDPSLNNYAYHYDYTKEDNRDPEDTHEPLSLVPAASNPHAPTSWFHYLGNWGDEVYSLADPRQWRFFGQYHYVTGPEGPLFKTLNRTKMCQKQNCKILYNLDPKNTWY